MRLLWIIPLAAAGFCSCLMKAPVKKENIRAAEFNETAVGGELGQRIAASLAILRREVRDTGGLFRADGGECVSPRAGNALLGIVVMSRAAGADRKDADGVFNAITANLNPAGYLGTVEYGIADESQLAGHGLLIRGLCEYYLWTGESAALDLAQTVCDSLYVPIAGMIPDYPTYLTGSVLPDSIHLDTIPQPVESSPADTSQASRPLVNGWRLSARERGGVFYALEGLAQLYGLRKAEATQEVVGRLADLFKTVSADPDGFASAPYLAGVKGLLRYGEARGTTGLNNDAADAWDAFRDRAFNRFYGIPPVIGDTSVSVSPAAASSAFITAVWLWALNGKGDYLEDADRVFYNNIYPSQTAEGNFSFLHAPDPLQPVERVPADSSSWDVSWVEALARVARFSYFMRDNRIIIPFYTTGELDLPQKGVHIVQSSDYPAGRSVKFEITEAPKRGLVFQVLFPAYMTMKSITLNGTTTISGTVNSIGLLEFRDVFRKGDVIELNYSLSARWADTDSDDTDYKDLYRAVQGPMLLSYRADTLLWLERGVSLKGDDGGGFILDSEFGYRRDTVSGLVRVLNSMGGENVAGTEQYDPPVLRPLFRPFGERGRDDVFPAYVVTRIGKE
ncbi:MAG: glycoside hydrolase family 127 protein [Alistipes sp.]|nr:glycoside hydrolase family 127 protein [Alistipes sp.]